jgi:NTP pyrophosphatase (non-canonical NTP hydrolase)
MRLGKQLWSSDRNEIAFHERGDRVAKKIKELTGKEVKTIEAEDVANTIHCRLSTGHIVVSSPDCVSIYEPEDSTITFKPSIEVVSLSDTFRDLDLEAFVVWQGLHRAWLQHNFPKQAAGENRHHGILGAMEELGELSHAFLKLEQGIRGATNDDVADAVADVIIFLLSFCCSMNIDFRDAIQKAGAEVYARDWIKYPMNGVSA